MNMWLLIAPMYFVDIETAVILDTYETKQECQIAAMETKERYPLKPLVCLNENEIYVGEVFLVPIEIKPKEEMKEEK